VSAEKDPTKVPYQGVDIAMECTGRFTKKEAALALVQGRRQKVLISAPATAPTPPWFTASTTRC